MSKRAGLRQARQNLAGLIEEVRKGREIELTDRGRPVARLVPIKARAKKPVPDLAAFRARMPVLDAPLSSAILAEREESPY